MTHSSLALHRRLATQMVIWFAITAFFALTIASFFNYYSTLRTFNKNIENNLRATAKREYEKIEYFLKHLHDIALNSIQAIQLIPDSNQSAFLEKIAGDHPFITNITLVDSNQNITYTTNSNIPLEETIFTNFLKKIEENKTIQFSSIIENNHEFNPAFFIAAPILIDNQIQKILILQIDAKTIYNIIDDPIGLGGTGEIILAEKKEDKLIFISPSRFDSNMAFNIEFSLQKLEKPLFLGSGYNTFKDHRNIEVFASWEFIPETQWVVIVKEDKDEALAPVEELRSNMTSVSSIILLTILLLAFLLAHTITRPVENLTQIAIRIASGDLILHSYDPPPPNEIGILQQSIKTMAQNLTSLVTQIKKSSQKLNQNTKQIASSINQQTSVAEKTSAISQKISSMAQNISTETHALVKTMDGVNEIAVHSANQAQSGLNNIQSIENVLAQLEHANTFFSNQFHLIEAKTKVIREMVTIVTDVADKINLFAVNMAIASHHHGENHEIFDSSSQEIRRLATQTASSVLEIESMVHLMEEGVRNGVKGLDLFSKRVSQGIQSITSANKDLLSIISEMQIFPTQFKSVLEGIYSQNSNASQINSAITELTKSTEETMMLLKNTHESLDQLYQAANDLQNEIEVFRT